MGIGIGVVAFAVVSVGFVGGMRLIVGIRLVVDRDITGVALVVDTIDRVFDVVAGLGGAIGGLVDLANPLTGSKQRQNETNTNRSNTDFATAAGHTFAEAENDRKRHRHDGGNDPHVLEEEPTGFDSQTTGFGSQIRRIHVISPSRGRPDAGRCSWSCGRWSGRVQGQRQLRRRPQQ